MEHYSACCLWCTEYEKSNNHDYWLFLPPICTDQGMSEEKAEVKPVIAVPQKLSEWRKTAGKRLPNPFV